MNNKYITLIVLMFSLLYFSPYIAEASEDEAEFEENNLAEKEKVNDQQSVVQDEDEAEEEEESKDSGESLDNPVEVPGDSEELPEEELGDQGDSEEKPDALDTSNDSEKQKGNNEFDEVQEIENNLMSIKTTDTPEEIIQLKKNLTRLKFGGMNINGTYGSFTKQRVEEFQKYYGLTVDGIAGSQTKSQISKVLNSPFQKGKRHEKTIELKRNLNLLGFGGMNINDLYGSFTAQRVSQFQKAHGLKDHGIADEKTLDKINSILSNTYKEGNRHESIKQLKVNLTLLGFGGMNINDLYGSYTAKRVSDFQAYYGLTPSGKGTSETLAKIDQLLSSPFQQGKRHQETKTLKENLNRLGFGGMNINDLYGSFTAQRVGEFQRYYGLTVNKIVDDRTQSKIDKVLGSDFQEGKRHEKTKELKRDLNRLGYGGMNINDLYGSFTAKRVSQFQADHGLKAHGIADEKTLSKIDSVLSNVFKQGVRHNSIKQLKRDLTRLGFGGMNINDLYGSYTAKRVRDFQSHYGLTLSGKGDPATLAKIDNILSSPFREGIRDKATEQLKRDLNSLGFGGMNINNLYGSFTAKRVKEFQKANSLPVSGIADEITLEKISTELKNIKTKEVRKSTNYDLTLDQALEIQMKVAPQTDSKYAWVSKAYIDGNNKVTATNLNVRLGPGTNGKGFEVIGTLSNGTTVKILDEYNGWYAIEYSSTDQWRHASPNDVMYYLNPLNFINDSIQRFQFLDLAETSGVSKTVMNNFLKGKGTLHGQAEAFIEAGKVHGINDVYLISHAILETGNGTSTLATGVKYNGVTVYNMFGIGAYDNCALTCGAKKAYEEGWTTPEKAIIGGAQFIGNDYVKAGQNTLYKMRWNPLSMENGTANHQYATDVGWASKQITTMYNLYEQIGSYTLYLDIPDYK